MKIAVFVLLSPQKMFAAEAKKLIDKVGDKELIYNESLIKKVDLLTLVKVSKGKFWPVQKYKIMQLSLPELMEVEDFSPGVYSDA